MSDGIKVSILVPVYNAELFLVECLDSLMNQTLQKIEIICINDGSKDGSLKIIEKCAKNDKRIRIINKKNSGYGDSMNIGLEKARGEYIGIVEPDDFVDFDAFKSMYDLASRYNADIVKGNYYDYYGNSGTDKQVSDMFSSDIVNRVVDPRIEKNIFYQLPSIWAAIYKREFLINNKISFLPSPGASYQDVGFSFKTWAVARRVYLVKRAFLHYRRDNEKSSVKDSGKIFCVKDEHDSIEEYLIERHLMDELGSVAFACRFGSYAWNLERLDFSSAMKFAKTITNDYKRAKREGFLDKRQLDEISKYIVNQEAIRHPRIHLFRGLLHGFGRKCSKVLWILFPRYRQRVRTIEYLSELNESQNELRILLMENEITSKRRLVKKPIRFKSSSVKKQKIVHDTLSHKTTRSFSKTMKCLYSKINIAYKQQEFINTCIFDMRQKTQSLIDSLRNVNKEENNEE